MYLETINLVDHLLFDGIMNGTDLFLTSPCQPWLVGEMWYSMPIFFSEAARTDGKKLAGWFEVAGGLAIV